MIKTRTGLLPAIALCIVACASVESRIRESDPSSGQHRSLPEVVKEEEEEPKYYPEVFEFTGKIELMNGNLQCIESNLDATSQVFVDTVEKLDSHMDDLIFEDRTILAVGAQFTTKLSPDVSSGESRRRLGFVYNTRGYTRARMSYSDDSDGFIPALSGPEKSVLNFNIPELLEEHRKQMLPLRAELAALDGELAKKREAFDAQQQETQTRITQKKEEIALEKAELEDARAILVEKKLSLDAQRETTTRKKKLKRIDKQLRKNTKKMDKNEKKMSQLEEDIAKVVQLEEEMKALEDEFKKIEEDARQQLEQKIAFLWSLQQMELSTIMIAREPAWNDFKASLNVFKEETELKIAESLFELLPGCFLDAAPEIKAILTPVHNEFDHAETEGPP